MLEGDFTIAGKKFPKQAVVFGLGGTALVAGYVLYKKRQNQTALTDAQAAGDMAASPGIDPATGYPYGSAEDQQALADFSVGPGLPSMGSDGGAGFSPGTPPTGFASNPQWGQAAILSVGSTGGDAKATAIGRYLLGQPLTPDQRRTVEQAIASQGFPPVAGLNGFPPSIKDAPESPAPPKPSNHPTTIVIADGKDTLRDIAAHSGTTTYQQAEKLNPWAHRYTVKTKPIPKGFRVKVYAHA